MVEKFLSSIASSCDFSNSDPYDIVEKGDFLLSLSRPPAIQIVSQFFCAASTENSKCIGGAAIALGLHDCRTSLDFFYASYKRMVFP